MYGWVEHESQFTKSHLIVAKIPKNYSFINGIMGRTKVNPMPPGKTDQQLANEFAGFFLAKIRKVTDDLASCPAYSPSVIDTKTLGVFQPMRVDNVKKIIMSMPSKSCESDAVLTSPQSHPFFFESPEGMIYCCFG